MPALYSIRRLSQGTVRVKLMPAGYTEAPLYTEPRAGDIRNSLADISAARVAFGYEPVVGFEEGIARTVDWCRQQLATERADEPVGT